jgi:26S proteasome non-ATPase regulatory subunit 9
MMQSLPNQVTAQDNDINSVEATLRQELAKLDIKRKTMEHEADAIFLELTTPPEEGVPPMGIDTPLVDQDGYPRGDIDIYRTRTMRGRFRTLKMDHKEISSEIENILLQLTVMKVRTIL